METSILIPGTKIDLFKHLKGAELECFSRLNMVPVKHTKDNYTNGRNKYAGQRETKL